MGPDKLKGTASEIIEIYFYQSHAKPSFRVFGERERERERLLYSTYPITVSHVMKLFILKIPII